MSGYLTSGLHACTFIQFYVGNTLVIKFMQLGCLKNSHIMHITHITENTKYVHVQKLTKILKLITTSI